MYLTVQCERCGVPAQQKDVDAGISVGEQGSYLKVSAYCKECHTIAYYWFKAEVTTWEFKPQA